MRDPLGGYPLFWTEQGGVLAMSTCQRPLLELLPGRTLNPEYVAEFLALPGAWVQEVPSEQCVYQGIQRVLPGSLVEAQPGKAVRRRAYWSWLERRIDPGTNRLEELAAAVEDRLRQAVRQQVRGSVAAHVSGGMDSTAVALLARDELGAGGRVHAISAVFERLGGLSRETPFLEAALQQPGLVPHRIVADNVLDYDAFANPPHHDEPYAGLVALGVSSFLTEAAAAAGADTVLTGHGADGLLDVLPYHVADHLRAGQLRAAWKDARAWAQAAHGRAWHYL
jgi:asparagine synthase (glutamine-hydrolysing)